MADQSIFLECYRGAQGPLRHASYMRMAKVLLVQHLFEKWRVNLSGKRFFDYGFGAGTLFRYCPKDTHLLGVELDEVAVRESVEMLKRLGYQKVDLRPLAIETWEAHPLMAQKYDVIVCSHVLEHLPDPVRFLSKIRQCLNKGGLFIGLVPLNEKRQDPHHVRIVTREVVQSWLGPADLRMVDWLEADHLLYHVQPLFTFDRGIWHKMAQALCMGVGAVATTLQFRRWMRLDRWFARLLLSKPMQAAFILAARQADPLQPASPGAGAAAH
jgi:SAM-dependent methyltransferase